jgi:Vam6/Vps39-like protein vacuolar protein sorting-associated protein 39
VTRIRSFEAVAQFRLGNFDAAIDTFLELDINPAKIVALYPEAVAGRLSVPEERWIALFGGPAPPPLVSEPADNESAHNSEGSSPAPAEAQDKAGAAWPDVSALSASNSARIRGRWRASIGALIAGTAVAPSSTDDDAASIKSSRTPPRSSSARRNTAVVNGTLYS